MKNIAPAYCRGYLLVNEADEYLAWSRVSAHSSLVAWAIHPEDACRFRTPEAAVVTASALRRLDLQLAVLLETPNQWLVQRLETHLSDTASGVTHLGHTARDT